MFRCFDLLKNAHRADNDVTQGAARDGNAGISVAWRQFAGMRTCLW